MRQVPDYGANPYRLDTVEQAVEAVREISEKSRILHEARSEAWQVLQTARVEHEFLVRAADHCDREGQSLRHRVETLVRRDALAAIGGAA